MPSIAWDYDGVGWSWPLALGLGGLGVAALAVFALVWGTDQAWSVVVGAALCNAVWIWSLRRWARPGRLGFDGTQWEWLDAGANQPMECCVQVAMDLNRFLLLQLTFSKSSSTRLLWLHRNDPQRWKLLRALLWSAPSS